MLSETALSLWFRSFSYITNSAQIPTPRPLPAIRTAKMIAVTFTHFLLYIGLCLRVHYRLTIFLIHYNPGRLLFVQCLIQNLKHQALYLIRILFYHFFKLQSLNFSCCISASISSSVNCLSRSYVS